MNRKLMVMVALGMVLLIGAYGIGELTMEQQSELIHPADQIQTSLEHISLVRKAVESGDTDQAIAELDKIQTLLQKAHMAVRPAVANTKCPMIGTQIEQLSVPEVRYTTFRGLGVGFCSPSCVEAWNGLNSDQQTDKLSQSVPEKVAIPTQEEFEKSMIDQRISQSTGCAKGCDCTKCQTMRTEWSQKAGFQEKTAQLTELDAKVSEMTGCPKGCSCIKCQAARAQLKAAEKFKPEKITGIGEVIE